MAKFKCSCDFHIIECDKKPIEDEDFISFAIYEHRSGHTGKLYKNPKLKGDVVLIGKEARRFKKWIKGKKNA